ncbi:hypothetical protein O7627_05915 [Solwaraspora sp. WMMD1047]|uniref:hypothetical protein n=1 Tax=Solwaraspora sp. WMMD1047 TaxID=3016102 RepID=UPI002416A57D|nr:hypothetical protein [Solwaraspora sp. WMMD1047]MDG4828841.1 hypothetical protein [Solwaraspora sp. WMMD1047]
MSYLRDESVGIAPTSPDPGRGGRRWMLVGVVVLGVLAVGAVVKLADAPRSRQVTPTAPPTPISYWPSAATTGVPAGTKLRDSGALSLRTDNQVVTGLNITGCVNVYARNVRITKSKISCGSPAYAIRTMSTAVNLVVEDVEIDGLGRNGVTICCGNYTLRRVNMYGMTDGPRLGTNTTVVDSYIHDLARLPGTHNDALQITGGVGVVVRRNTLQVYDAATNDPLNACLMLGSETAPSTRNLLFENNYCDGGNWSIGVRTDLVGANIVFKDNKFGRNYRYGIIARPDQAGIIWENTNVWFDNGRPVVP